jgi:hypothetical protein
MLKGIAVTLVVALVGVGWMWWRATEAEATAVKEARVARANESRALTALSTIASNEQHYIDAVKLETVNGFV